MTGERRAESRDRWAEALTWYVALRGKDRAHRTLALRREWQVWYADVANQRIFDSACRLLADRGCYRQRRRPGKAELEEDQYDLSMPLAEWRRAQSQNRRRRQLLSARTWWWSLSGGLGLAVMAVLLVLWLPRSGPGAGPPGATIYQTGVGGIKEVHLRDGSSVILGGQTEVSVAFSGRQRSVRLIAGEAWFKVAHDRKWPFVVAAGDGTITAVGTAFLITRDTDRVIVIVTDGTVEVSAQPPVWPPLRLVQRFSMRSTLLPVPVGRGEQLAFGDSGPLQPVRPADTRAATAWTHGRLTFDNQPLRYVVETINRYSSRRIIVDASAGALRFSGIVFDNDVQDWLKSLEVIFPVSEREQGQSVYIEMGAATPASSQALLNHRH